MTARLSVHNVLRCRINPSVHASTFSGFAARGLVCPINFVHMKQKLSTRSPYRHEDGGKPIFLTRRSYTSQRRCMLLLVVKPIEYHGEALFANCEGRGALSVSKRQGLLKPC